MEPLSKLTTGGLRNPTVKGFDFLVNSLWPEVEQRLEIHLSSVYAPGNPDMFCQRYCETLQFLQKLEQFCGTQVSVKRLHAHHQYAAFLHRWNLHVYFQIRFQEIAGTLETVMSEGNAGALSGNSEFQLRTTLTAWDCIIKCWSSEIYLHHLAHRAWKLNLQILARYYTWVGEALEETWSGRRERLEFLVRLYSDIEKLVTRFPSLLDHVTTQMGSPTQPAQDLLTNSLKESEQQVLTRLPLVTQFILGEISGQSLPHLRQVSDIPRLFRRTNREMPTKPCTYVAQVLRPVLTFHTSHKESVETSLLKQWITLTFSAITQQFYTSVDDVLTSVQKTEESLRCLKCECKY